MDIAKLTVAFIVLAFVGIGGAYSLGLLDGWLTPAPTSAGVPPA